MVGEQGRAKEGSLRRFLIACALEVPVVFVLVTADAFLFDGALLPWAFYVFFALYMLPALWYAEYGEWNPLPRIRQTRSSDSDRGGG